MTTETRSALLDEALAAVSKILHRATSPHEREQLHDELVSCLLHCQMPKPSRN
jgi:hypothetical protein